MPQHNPNAIIHNIGELGNLSVSITHFIVDCDSCNNIQLTSLDFAQWHALTVIEIGSHSFHYVDVVKMCGLQRLESVLVGNGCFTKRDDTFNADRHFYLKNCPSVRELKIGCNSFSDYSVCEIANVPSLEVITMGALGISTCCFSHVSLELKSDGGGMK